jgi:23S rRNA (uracil1939-C5)-methyltransferase
VVLVPFTLPGERAKIETEKDIDAELLEVVQPSPERISPPCPVFRRCGGCQYQHAPYSFQLSAKVEILREQLRRVGKIDYQGEIQTISGPDYGYRNRVQLHLRNEKLGYLAPRSHDLIPVSECPIASPKINALITQLFERMKQPKFPHFVKSFEVFTNETEIQLNVLETERPVAQWFFKSFDSLVALDYPTSAGMFRVSPKSFFQVNRFLIEEMVRAAVPAEGGGTALDLYAGVGLFALPLSQKFKKVVAVESGSAATRDLEFNVQRAGAKVDARNARVEDFLENPDARPDFVLADPPRAGLGKAVTAALNRLAPPRITIVSCDPATLARDLAALSKYRIAGMALIDLFPQTYHLETIVALEL